VVKLHNNVSLKVTEGQAPQGALESEVNTEGMARIQSHFIQNGYALLSENDLHGLGQMRLQMATYFTKNRLKRPGNEFPADRERARDVILYEWQDSLACVKLTENDNVTIRRPGGNRDEYSRVWILENSIGCRFAATILSLIPPCWRQRNGTLGINLLRTFTDIVTEPHQERFGQFAGIWVISKTGNGAETYLYDYFTPGRLVFKHVLQPGELIIFNDEIFLHGATPLSPINGQAIDHATWFGALAESEERFRRAFEDSAAGMALTDLKGRFIKVNRALCDMLRRSESELLTMTMSQVLTSGPPGCDPAQLLADVASGRRESAHFESGALCSDGKVQQVALAASAVRGADGAPVHLSLNLQDTTQRHAAERERRARREAEVARAVAEATSRAKSAFLTSLSHELRTPLQAVAGFAELLGTLDLPSERRAAALAHIQSATAHITSLVDDVLDIAKIEAGALPVHITDVDLATVISDALDLLSPLAAERGITLSRPQAGGWVRADQRRLRQVLINLITNAIRYNYPAGQVQVSIGSGPQTQTIRITDTGPGIRADLLDRLFVPFDRLGAEAGPEQGAGLGLPLARGLTEAMGGKLTLESGHGAGTTAAVSLPSLERDA
jgi:PAS domain S-box-containing protein